MPHKKTIIFADPKYFSIDYAINPFMTDSAGQLKKIDSALAKEQWQKLKALYESFGFEVIILEAKETLPDLVFTANQSMVFWKSKDTKPSVLLSKMRFQNRAPEVQLFRSVFEKRQYNILELPKDEKILGFEGNGDALPIDSRQLIIGGCGPRTSSKAYDYVKEMTGYEILKVTPSNRKFYHLDTCLSVLDDQTIAIADKAFEAKDLRTLKNYFPNVITISSEEAEFCFAANCHGVRGKRVVLQQGAPSFVKKLKDAGFETFEVDTSEFMKSGGSVFCMKMEIF